MRRQPLLDVGDVEAQECADLVEGDASLVHQSADEPLGDSESSSEADDVEHPLAIRSLVVAFRCHAGHRES